MKDLKVKVCGMKSSEEIQELIDSSLIDYIGFIFYPKSLRYITEVPKLDGKFKRVGVFVNEELETIQAKINSYTLDVLQLHGNESVSEVKQLKEVIQKPIFKAFGIDERFDFKICTSYEPYVDAFLFDTKTEKYGGSGKQFDWSILQNYKGEKPFVLSGGLDEKALNELKNYSFPKMVGVDLNSKFELSPGQKDTKRIIQTIKQIKNAN
ncbi:MAG: phosphoribosylanthranilate isomerase [Crocinitomicaceae bacterium]